MMLISSWLHNLEMVQCSIYTVYTQVYGIQNKQILVVSDIWVHNERVRESKSYEKNAILHMYLPSSSDTSLNVLSSNTDRGPPLRWFTGHDSLDCFGAGTCSRFPWLPIAPLASSSSSVVLLLVLGIIFIMRVKRFCCPPLDFIQRC